VALLKQEQLGPTTANLGIAGPAVPCTSMSGNPGVGSGQHRRIQVHAHRARALSGQFAARPVPLAGSRGRRH